VLEAAGADRARLIVIATPEGFQTRRIIELARRLNPGIDIAVRTQSEAEVAHLERQGVGLAIVGVRELAFGLLDHALRSLGTSEDKARRIVQTLRVSGEGGAFERRPAEPARGVPELRQHRDPKDDLSVPTHLSR
jgi:CPA2 family monovalent cation:H+ antiporter-2